MGDYSKVEKDLHRKGYGMLGTDSILDDNEARFTSRSVATNKKGANDTKKSKKTEEIVMEEVLQLDESTKQTILSLLQQGTSAQ